MNTFDEKGRHAPIQVPFLFRLGEVAKILGLSRTTVFRQIKSGRLGCVRIGRSVRVSQIQLEEFISESS